MRTFIVGCVCIEVALIPNEFLFWFHSEKDSFSLERDFEGLKHLEHGDFSRRYRRFVNVLRLLLLVRQGRT